MSQPTENYSFCQNASIGYVKMDFKKNEIHYTCIMCKAKTKTIREPKSVPNHCVVYLSLYFCLKTCDEGNTDVLWLSELQLNFITFKVGDKTWKFKPFIKLMSFRIALFLIMIILNTKSIAHVLMCGICKKWICVKKF